MQIVKLKSEILFSPYYFLLLTHSKEYTFDEIAVESIFICGHWKDIEVYFYHNYVFKSLVSEIFICLLLCLACHSRGIKKIELRNNRLLDYTEQCCGVGCGNGSSTYDVALEYVCEKLLKKFFPQFYLYGMRALNVLRDKIYAYKNI